MRRRQDPSSKLSWHLPPTPIYAMRPLTDYLHQGSHHFQYLSTTIWGGCVNSLSFLFRLIFPAGKERRDGITPYFAPPVQNASSAFCLLMKSS